MVQKPVGLVRIVRQGAPVIVDPTKPLTVHIGDDVYVSPGRREPPPRPDDVQSTEYVCPDPVRAQAIADGFRLPPDRPLAIFGKLANVTAPLEKEQPIMSDVESIETHPTQAPIENGTVNGQLLQKLDRSQKRTIETIGTVDHVAIRRAATKELEEERAACVKRAAEITAELGDDIISMVASPVRLSGATAPGSLPRFHPVKARGRADVRSGKKPGRLKRRSPEQIAIAVADIVDLLRKHPDGLRAEQIRVELDLEAREMPRVLREGFDKKLLRCTGQKRATTYFAKGK
jgi:hypothetical protein